MATPIWHSLSITETASHLRSRLDSGLSAEDVKKRAKALVKAPSSDSTRAFLILWNQLKGGVIVVLLIAMIASLFLGENGNAIGIGLSVVLSVFFGFLTDFRAERALQALKKLTSPTARVLRDGVELEIPTASLCVGDLLVLQAGARVPADARLVIAHDLQIDESLLTGESLPVTKSTEPLSADLPVSDRSNMVFSGASVVTGSGKGLVTALAHDTELGRIGRLVTDQEKKDTPLQKQAEQLGRQLAALVIALSAAIVALGLIRHHPFLLMIETGVILAIAAIPEGLPAVTTVALAAGVHRMAKINALVRRLSSVETLGTVSVICTDKTGTLTENNMRVTRILTPDREIEVSGSGYTPTGEFRYNKEIIDLAADPSFRSLSRVARICNNAKLESHDESGWHIHGSSTEGALLVMAEKAKVAPEDKTENFTRIKEFAFNSDRKRMTVVARQADGALWAFMKGSPEHVLRQCSHVLRDGKKVSLTDADRKQFSETTHRLGDNGFRVLAFADRPLSSLDEINSAEDALTWLGQVAIMDPPRAEVRTAIAELQSAGIRTVMITGDQKTTAMAIGRDLGLFKEGDLCLNSIELAEYVRLHRWDDLRKATIFARVTPEDKLSIVKALKEAGHYVGMAGDGINDAPALKAADIGVAIGSKSADVAKEASDLVVTDGNYSTIPTAVKEGRQIYSNIRRAVQYLLLCSFSTIGVMMVSIVANLPIPMTPLQILWLNLAVHIFPAIALAFVESEPNLMSRKPRDPKERLLPWRSMGWVAARSAVVTSAAIWAYASEQSTGHTIHAQSMMMTTLAVVLLFQMFAALSDTRSFFSMKGSLTWVFWLALVGGLGVQAAATQLKWLQVILGTIPLDVGDIMRVFILALVALVTVEIIKVWVTRPALFLKKLKFDS